MTPTELPKTAPSSSVGAVANGVDLSLGFRVMVDAPHVRNLLLQEPTPLSPQSPEPPPLTLKAKLRIPHLQLLIGIRSGQTCKRGSRSVDTPGFFLIPSMRSYKLHPEAQHPKPG